MGRYIGRHRFVRFGATLVIASLVWFGGAVFQGAIAATILVYHRFGPVVNDSMTVTTSAFEQQLNWLTAHDYRVVPLRVLVDSLQGKSSPLSASAVAITADDGHQSVYTDMFPLIKRYKIAVTLFIYPSAISNASYAMTWAELDEMARSGLVDVQSHTYWHPNFKIEAARLDRSAYEKFVDMQLRRSKESLAAHLHVTIDMLAWPFGIHDTDLEEAAQRAGYIAAFTLERRQVRVGDDLFALPRYLVTDLDRGPRFDALLRIKSSDERP